MKRETPSPHIRNIETAIFVDDEMYKWAGQQSETNSMEATTTLIMALMTAVIELKFFVLKVNIYFLATQLGRVGLPN